MTTAADLLDSVAFASPAGGGDDPNAVVTAWLGGRTPAEAITAAVLDLNPAARLVFLDRWTGGQWRLAILAHDRHPALDALVDFARPRDDVILLATPSGPPPPAVLTVEAEA